MTSPRFSSIPPEQAALVLTGFMGAGKSTVGALWAERLGWRFVDLDAELVAHFGQSIAEVFEQRGPSKFRKAEAELCQRWAREPRIVLATGGGTLLDPESRQALRSQAHVFQLDCGVDTIMARLGDDRSRPLFDPSEAEASLTRRLSERAGLYQSVWLQQSSEPAAEQVVDELEAKRAQLFSLPLQRRLCLETRIGHSNLLYGHGLARRLATLLSLRNRQPSQLLIVTDDTVKAAQGAVLEALRAETGALVFAISAGERHKTFQTVNQLYEFCAQHSIDRSAVIVAFGGGVVGDLAGFVAATWMRGLEFIQVPTTLLAMVDASVGGKTAYDRPEGKNLVGAFKVADQVIIDPSLLATLPIEEQRCGLAEAVKHAVIDAPELWPALSGEPLASPDSWLPQAIEVKARVVAGDPLERGQRALLNLGHTFGHAFELLSEFQLRHGEAVAVGMLAAATLAERLGLSTEPLRPRLEALLAGLGLATALANFTADEVLAAMRLDKKKQGRSLRLILPRALGRVEIVRDVPDAEVLAAIRSVLSNV